jgi:S1-C subfamily serine protease
MDREPASPSEAGLPAPRPRLSRRLIAAGAAIVVLLVAVAVLATRLADSSTPAAAGAAAAPSASPSPSATSLTVAAIYQRIAPSMVLVRTPTGLGSGFIVTDDGTILTAYHVVAKAKIIRVTFADGTTTAATVASADTKMDIATLTPARAPSVVVPATLGGAAAVGAPVVAVGNPLGLTDSVSSGVVSGLKRSAVTDTGARSGLIQFDAAVNPGSSGGPLLDAAGEVVGVVVALADADGEDAFAGIGFAVPIGSAVGGSGSGAGKGPQI